MIYVEPDNNTGGYTMYKAIKHHLNKNIIQRQKLTGGYTFQTWLLTLSDNQKVVFRTQKDFETSGGRKIIISDVLEREKFFYSNVNRHIGHICPEIFVIDNSCEHHGDTFCIMEYIEGTPLDKCFDNFDTKTKNDVLYKIGETAARINSLQIDSNHPYIVSRGTWEEYIIERLRERLTPLIPNKIITQDEIDAIVEIMCGCNISKPLSFLHLDLRRTNMIYNNGNIFILDAENCEFSDPLWEIAVIDVGNELEPPLLEGYKNVHGKDLDIESNLYNCFKIERQALVTDLFLNEITNDKHMTSFHLDKFYDVKRKLL